MLPLSRLALVFGLGLCAACSGDDDDDDADADGDADADADADADSDGDADTDADADGDADACVDPDTECPAEHPQPGGPCATADECPYAADEPDARWIYRCVDGAWDPAYECNAVGCNAVPPLAELCLDPFAGTLEGATIHLGPASVTDPFRDFADPETVVAIYGPQGGAMIPYRVRVDAPAGTVPECVGITSTLTVDGETGEPFVSRLAIHCGTSLAVFAVFPFQDVLCASSGETLAVTLDVELAGVGTASANVEFESEGCPLGQ